MNVAGPSRVPLAGQRAPRGGVESTYEEDLLGLLDQLSLDEMDEMQTFFTHRARDGNPLSDHDIAMNDLLQQARALAVFNEDRVLAQRIATGEGTGAQQVPIQTPGVVPRPNNDNRTATQQNGNQRREVEAARNSTSPQTFGGWLSSMVDWVFGSTSTSEPGPTSASTAAPKAPVTNRLTGHDCVICQDPIRGAEIRAPCGHYYDIGCVTDLIQSATTDETLFPPRCCRQNIPFTQVQPHLSQALVMTFQQKQLEFSTLKRVYCSSPTCSRFLGALSEGMFAGKVYTCPAPGCGRRTCGKCREQHASDWTHVCRPDADAAQVLELSRAAGWARCPGCSQMIELNLGCFHMTCRCRTEFCYLCRARWKSCRCPQWDERRLLAAAEERVDAQLGDQGWGVRRNAPAVPAHPVLIPVPAPPRNPLAAAQDANRAPAGIPRVRPPVPVPPLAQRHVPLPAQVRPPAPVQPPTVQRVRPQPTPAPVRTPAAGASTSSNATGRATIAYPAPQCTQGRPASTVSTSTATTRTATVGSRNPFASASASTSTSASASTSTSASASSPGVGRAWRPKSVRDDVDVMRQRMVRDMMDRLRVDHDCAHTAWRYRRGGGCCQSCGHNLPLYLFRCQGCEMLACNRCRRNRL